MCFFNNHTYSVSSLTDKSLIYSIFITRVYFYQSALRNVLRGWGCFTPPLPMLKLLTRDEAEDDAMVGVTVDESWFGVA